MAIASTKRSAQSAAPDATNARQHAANLLSGSSSQVSSSRRSGCRRRVRPCTPGTAPSPARPYREVWLP